MDDYAVAWQERDLPPLNSDAPDIHYAWIGVPMLVGDRLVGILASNRPRPFTADNSRLLEAIAGLCAVAIENAGLVQLVSETAQDLLRRTKELSDLNNVASAVNRSLDLGTVLAEGADMLLRATGWDLATVFLQEPSGHWDVAMSRHAGSAAGLPAPAWLREPPGDSRDSPALEPLIVRALANRRPVDVDMAGIEPANAAYRAPPGHGPEPVVVFPLQGARPSAGEEPPCWACSRSARGALRASRARRCCGTRPCSPSANNWPLPCRTPACWPMCRPRAPTWRRCWSPRRTG